MFFVNAIGPAFGQATLLDATPKVKAYWAAVQADAHVAKVLGELTKALSDYMSQPRG
jgi:hypothetical protein